MLMYSGVCTRDGRVIGVQTCALPIFHPRVAHDHGVARASTPEPPQPTPRPGSRARAPPRSWATRGWTASRPRRSACRAEERRVGHEGEPRLTTMVAKCDGFPLHVQMP